MRTRVRIRSEHRDALLAVAAERGERGISGVLDEAIALYLRTRGARTWDRAPLSSLKGCLTPIEAQELRRNVDEARANWGRPTSS